MTETATDQENEASTQNMLTIYSIHELACIEEHPANDMVSYLIRHIYTASKVKHHPNTFSVTAFMYDFH